MRNIRYAVSAVASCAAWLALALSAAAADVNPAYVGKWGLTKFGQDAAIEITSRGSFTGKSVGARYNCTFVGGFSDLVRNSPTNLDGVGSARLRCENSRLSGDYRVAVNGTPSGLYVSMGSTSYYTGSLTMDGLTRSGAFLGTGANEAIVSAKIPGHWQGTDHGVTVAVDVAQNGSITATIEGSAGVSSFTGCTLVAEMPPDQGLQNDEQSFVGMGPARMSGCTQKSVNGAYAALIAAKPDGLSLSVLLTTSRLLFRVQDLVRVSTPPALLSSPSPQIVNLAIPGTWTGEFEDIHVRLTLAADGKLTGRLSGPEVAGCRFRGSVPPAGAVHNDGEGFVGFGDGTMLECASGAANGHYVPFIAATSTGLSTMLIRADTGETLVEIGEMTRSASLGADGGLTAAVPILAGHYHTRQPAYDNVNPRNQTTLVLDAAADGKVTVRMGMAPFCNMTGVVRRESSDGTSAQYVGTLDIPCGKFPGTYTLLIRAIRFTDRFNDENYLKFEVRGANVTSSSDYAVCRAERMEDFHVQGDLFHLN